jgi:hypothetical protein
MRKLIGLSVVAFFAAAGAMIVYRLDETGFNITVGSILALLAAVVGGLLALTAAALIARISAPGPREVERLNTPQVPQAPIIIVGGDARQLPQLQAPPWPAQSWPGNVRQDADALKIVGEDD